jgi:hypothetical protein
MDTDVLDPVTEPLPDAASNGFAHNEFSHNGFAVQHDDSGRRGRHSRD